MLCTSHVRVTPLFQPSQDDGCLSLSALGNRPTPGHPLRGGRSPVPFSLWLQLSPSPCAYRFLRILTLGRTLLQSSLWFICLDVSLSRTVWCCFLARPSFLLPCELWLASKPPAHCPSGLGSYIQIFLSLFTLIETSWLMYLLLSGRQQGVCLLSLLLSAFCNGTRLVPGQNFRLFCPLGPRQAPGSCSSETRHCLEVGEWRQTHLRTLHLRLLLVLICSFTN
jgi:hypothetical protein